MLTGRQKEILRIILTNNEPLFRQDLASRVNVSVRTLFNETQVIGDYLNKYNIQLLYHAGSGFVLNGDIKLLKDLIKNQVYYIPQNKEERDIFILFELLNTSCGMEMSEISDEIYISRTTIILSLKRLEDTLLKTSGLTITNNSNHITLVGSEIDKRNLIVKLLNEYYGKELFNYIGSLLNRFGVTNKDEYIEVFKLILSALDEKGILLTDESLHILVLVFLWNFDRIRNDFKIEDEDYESDIELDYRQLASYLKIEIS